MRYIFYKSSEFSERVIIGHLRTHLPELEKKIKSPENKNYLPQNTNFLLHRADLLKNIIKQLDVLDNDTVPKRITNYLFQMLSSLKKEGFNSKDTTEFIKTYFNKEYINNINEHKFKTKNIHINLALRLIDDIYWFIIDYTEEAKNLGNTKTAVI